MGSHTRTVGVHWDIWSCPHLGRGRESRRAGVRWQETSGVRKNSSPSLVDNVRGEREVEEGSQSSLHKAEGLCGYRAPFSMMLWLQNRKEGFILNDANLTKEGRLPGKEVSFSITHSLIGLLAMYLFNIYSLNTDTVLGTRDIVVN